MAWETRKGRAYYYRSVRENGRVVKEYVGCAAWVGALAHLEARDREKADEERAQIRADLARWDALDRTLSGTIEEAKALVRLTLTAAGYHRHDRGAWRKKRRLMEVKSEVKSEMVDALKEERAIRSFTVPETHAERFKIVSDALSGNKKGAAAAPALACLRQYPDTVTTRETGAIDTVLEIIAGRMPVMLEILRREARQQRDTLLGANPSPLECLLVDSVVACGIQLRYLEKEYAARLTDGMPLQKSEHYRKKIDSAHKRYLSAIRTLAQVRRLELPSVSVALPGSTQVNVGEKQINLAQAGAEQVNLQSA